MLCSNRFDCFQPSYVIVLLVFILIFLDDGQIVASRILKDEHSEAVATTTMKQVPFEEYFIEHNVSQRDAKKIFHDVGIKLLDKPLPSWCMKCTDQIMNYCLSGKMLDDHCCCDSRHEKEIFPWIPHSCYVGEKCTPSTGSCIMYTDYRECCCDRALAKRWKTIYSASSTISVDRFIQLICGTILVICLRYGCG